MPSFSLGEFDFGTRWREARSAALPAKAFVEAEPPSAVSAPSLPTAGAGRHAARVAPSRQGPVGVGLAIHIDQLIAADVDLTGVVRHHEVITGDQRGVPMGTVLARAGAALEKVIERARHEDCAVAGVVVAVPGVVDTRGRLLRLAAGLGWHDVDVISELRARADGRLDGIPITIENEANLCALAELWRGGHVDDDSVPARSFLHVLCGTGVGGAIVLDGALYRGRHGFAGELGHVQVPVDQLPRGLWNRLTNGCVCGGNDCLEQFISLDVLCRLGGVQDLAELERGARAGWHEVRAVLEFAGTTLGRALAGVLNVLDLDIVIIEGTPVRLGQWMLPPLQAELERSVVTAGLRPVIVRPGVLGPGAAVIGGAESAVRSNVADPLYYALR